MAIIVTLPYDPTWKALEWAKKNCTGYITNTGSNTNKRTPLGTYQYIDYFFCNEKEALMFRLKWQ